MIRKESIALREKLTHFHKEVINDIKKLYEKINPFQQKKVKTGGCF